MARRPEYLRTNDPVPRAIERHMAAMGFIRSRAYLDWCWANGFAATFEKSRSDLQEERDTFDAIVEQKKKQSRLHKFPKVFLQAVCQGDLTSDEIDRPNYKRTAAEIEVSSESEETRESLLEMLLTLIRYDDLVFGSVPGSEDIAFVRGLIKLHDRKALWLRPLDQWKPKSKNPLRQFGDLTHHLFDKFGDVPSFMEAAWLRNDRPSWRYRDWYVHLGRGHNLRTAKSPVKIAKKMAHEFLRAPQDYTVEQAVRWGQLRALGAGQNTINALVATRLGRSFENEEFWFTVLRFIADSPMLDPRQIGPLVDYLQNQRFEPTEVEIAPGEWRQDPPPQPGLSMRGRTVETLLRQVDDWHRSLGRLRRLSGEVYAKAEFDGIALEKKFRGQPNRWVIRQLRSARELQSESEELRHCVASYHWSCARGDCTIWSLSSSTDDKSFERRQTIEVNKGGMIVQCRGLANRDPSSEEWSIVNAWAREANLQIAPYL
jgi:PcfJ-like protein